MVLVALTCPAGGPAYLCALALTRTPDDLKNKKEARQGRFRGFDMTPQFTGVEVLLAPGSRSGGLNALLQQMWLLQAT